MTHTLSFLLFLFLPRSSLPPSFSPYISSVTSNDLPNSLFCPYIRASPTPAPPSPPSDPYIYPVPRSRVTITFSNYGDPVSKNPALICLTAVSHDFWEHATRELDKVVGVPLEYRFRGVGLTIVPVGRELTCRGRWTGRSIGPMEQGLRYFEQTYGARDMLFDISVAGVHNSHSKLTYRPRDGPTSPLAHPIKATVRDIKSLAFLFLSKPINPIAITDVLYDSDPQSSNSDVAPQNVVVGQWYNDADSNVGYSLSPTHSVSRTNIRGSIDISVEAELFDIGFKEPYGFTWGVSCESATTTGTTSATSVACVATGTFTPYNGVKVTDSCKTGQGSFDYTSTVTVSLKDGTSINYKEKGTLTNVADNWCSDPTTISYATLGPVPTSNLAIEGLPYCLGHNVRSQDKTDRQSCGLPIERGSSHGEEYYRSMKKSQVRLYSIQTVADYRIPMSNRIRALDDESFAMFEDYAYSPFINAPHRELQSLVSQSVQS
ncbi:hypothetical protein BDR22DRAFT_963179 [Usnea florida]